MPTFVLSISKWFLLLFSFSIPLIAFIGFNFFIFLTAITVNKVIKIILIIKTIPLDKISNLAFHIKPVCISIALFNIGIIEYESAIPARLNNKPLIIYGNIFAIIISLLVYPNAFKTPKSLISSSIDCSILNLLTSKLTSNITKENIVKIKTRTFEIASLLFLDCSS